ncbi:hypothetical protein BDR26DRAFT_928815 [Obelidium mucronatum]|nr:hypothetical protein BDR26DRAFT_928815 [Obelidium mucronatum]
MPVRSWKLKISSSSLIKKLGGGGVEQDRPKDDVVNSHTATFGGGASVVKPTTFTSTASVQLVQEPNSSTSAAPTRSMWEHGCCSGTDNPDADVGHGDNQVKQLQESKEREDAHQESRLVSLDDVQDIYLISYSKLINGQCSNERMIAVKRIMKRVMQDYPEVMWTVRQNVKRMSRVGGLNVEEGVANQGLSGAEKKRELLGYRFLSLPLPWSAALSSTSALNRRPSLFAAFKSTLKRSTSLSEPHTSTSTSSSSPGSSSSSLLLKERPEAWISSLFRRNSSASVVSNPEQSQLYLDDRLLFQEGACTEDSDSFDGDTLVSNGSDVSVDDVDEIGLEKHPGSGTILTTAEIPQQQQQQQRQQQRLQQQEEYADESNHPVLQRKNSRKEERSIRRRFADELITVHTPLLVHVISAVTQYEDDGARVAASVDQEVAVLESRVVSLEDGQDILPVDLPRTNSEETLVDFCGEEDGSLVNAVSKDAVDDEEEHVFQNETPVFQELDIATVKRIYLSSFMKLYTVKPVKHRERLLFINSIMWRLVYEYPELGDALARDCQVPAPPYPPPTAIS